MHAVARNNQVGSFINRQTYLHFLLTLRASRVIEFASRVSRLSGLIIVIFGGTL